MPRPKKPGAPEPKRRSRNGCWPCKARKVKCDETHPTCENCQRQGETCDYSIRLNWEGRSKKKTSDDPAGGSQITFQTTISSFPSGTTIAGSSDSSRESPPAGQSSFSTFQPSLANTSGYHTSIPTARPPYAARPSSSAGSNPGTSYNTPPKASSIRQDTSFPDSSLEIRPPPSHEGQYSRQSPYLDSPERQSVDAVNQRTFQPPALSRVRETSHQTNLIQSPGGSGPASPVNFTLPGPAHHGIAPPTSTPTLQELIEKDGSGTVSADRPNKRLRYAQSPPDQGSPSSYKAEMRPPLATPLSPFANDSRSTSQYNAGFSPASTPLTPAGSTMSDDGGRSYYVRHSPHISHDSPDIRRLSVNSLLSGPPGIPSADERASLTPATSNTDSYSPKALGREPYEDYTLYGLDRGFKDLDIGLNEDQSAITGHSPSTLRERNNEPSQADSPDEFVPTEFGFGLQAKDSAERGYYARPVPVKIPRSLEPLPSHLLDNPMNLLHHFLNHTARVLTPHDCDANPFRRVLPRMALQDSDLLNLLLAYSASHRARLLQHPEPATRIALYVQDIFPRLRHALNDPSKMISNANLATAIMLASLEIISPKAFGVAVPWQHHLDTAREMITSRGGVQSMLDEASSFLLRWYAYLDVLGRLSGGLTSYTSVTAQGTGARKAPSVIVDYPDVENDGKIDCLFGFTSRCIRLLAKVAELSQYCDEQRIDEHLNIRPDWTPSPAIVTQAEHLKHELHLARHETSPEPCPYLHSSGENKYQWDSLEMQATNEAYHWAGIAQVERRCLGKPSTHDDVQLSVREIVKTLYKVRKDSTAAACLVFPMFTAGCDALDARQRRDIIERFKSIEECGMAQVHKARRLVEVAWETGRPWETLVQGEFFG